MDFGIQTVVDEMNTTELRQSSVERNAAAVRAPTARKKSLVLEAPRHCK